MRLRYCVHNAFVIVTNNGTHTCGKNAETAFLRSCSKTLRLDLEMDQNSNIDLLTIRIWLFQALNCAVLVFKMLCEEQLMLIGPKKLKTIT